MSRQMIEKLEKEINELKCEIDKDKKSIQVLQFKTYMLNLLIYKNLETTKQDTHQEIVDMNNYLKKLIDNSKVVIKNIPKNLSDQITLSQDEALYDEYYEHYKNNHINNNNMNSINNGHSLDNSLKNKGNTQNNNKHLISNFEFKAICKATKNLKTFLSKNEYLSLIVNLARQKEKKNKELLKISSKVHSKMQNTDQ